MNLKQTISKFFYNEGVGNKKFDANLVTKYFKDIQPNISNNENEFFIDNSFPPNEFSLLGKNAKGEYIDSVDGERNATAVNPKSIEWKRISEVLGDDVEVFEGKIEKDDVQQGGLGNCYFLSVLAALSVKPYLIYQLFRTRRKSKQGLYEVVLYIDGIWQVVFIDDYFPVSSKSGKLSFAKPNGKEMWVLILEKAWAKVNGGYACTIGGDCGEPLYALTGFSNETLIHRDIKISVLWEKLKLANSTNNIICSNTYENKTYRNGLIKGHAYTVVDVIETKSMEFQSQVNSKIKSTDKYILPKVTNDLLKLENIVVEQKDENASLNTNNLEKLSCNNMDVKDNKNSNNNNNNYSNLKEHKGFIKDLGLVTTTQSIIDPPVIQFVKLRNPWGNADWKGLFSKNSEQWYDKIKEDINYSEEPGVFYMTIEEFQENFHLSFICHIMYDAHIKCYLLDYEEYFAYPLVFNFYLEEASKVSLSVIFKSWRFHRNLRGAERPVSLVIANYTTDRLITYFDGAWSLLESSLEFVGTINKGFYCAWLYFPYELYSQASKPLECVFKISSVKEIFPKFMGSDKTFLLIQKLIVDYIKSSEASSIESCENYYQSLTECLAPAGLTALVVINKCDAKILKIQFSIKELQNVCLIPPYKGLESFGNSIPPKTGVAVVAVRSSYESSEFSFKTKQKIIDYNLDYDKPQLDEFLSLEVFLEEDIMIHTFTYTFSSETKAVREINFDYTNDTCICGESKEDHLEVSELLLDNPRIMNLVNTLLPTQEEEEALSSNTAYWTKREMNNASATYYGLVDSHSFALTHRGGIVFNNGELLIGYWKNSKLEGFGKHFSQEKHLIYEGEYSNSKKNGYGKYFYLNGDQYEGLFKDDMFEGKGVFLWKNHIKWEGTFAENKKHGIGVLCNIKQNRLLEIIEFKDDRAVKRKAISEDLEYLINQQIDSMPKNKRIIGNVEEDILKSILSQGYKNPLPTPKNSNPEYSKQALNTAENNNIENERKGMLGTKPIIQSNSRTKPLLELPKDFRENYFALETDVFKLKDFGNDNDHDENESESAVLVKARETDVFAVTLFLKHFELDLKQLKGRLKHLMTLNSKITKDEEKEIKSKITLKEKPYLIFKKLDIGFYLGEANGKGVFNGTGVLFKSHSYETYLAGRFKDGVINGFAESFTKAKELVFSGEFIDGFYHGTGEFHYENGDKYSGEYKNSYKHGNGIYFWSDGSCWKGQFHFDKMHGEGKYYYKSSPFTQTVKYTDNLITGKGEITNENISQVTQKDKETLEALKEKYFEVFEKLMLLPPTLDSNAFKWAEIQDSQNNTYVGQVDEEGVFQGRGCYIVTAAPKTLKKDSIKDIKEQTLEGFFNHQRWGIQDIKYYIGYWKHGVKHNHGYYYNFKFQLIYEGEFFEDNIHGLGRYHYLKTKSLYDGEFANNLKHGQGVYNWPNYRWEGSFNSDKLHGSGFFIFNNFKSTELIEYDKGNIIRRAFTVSNTDKQKRIEKIKQINELKVQRETAMKHLLNLKSTDDDVCLDWLEFRMKQGTFIGQVNSLRKPQGRGALYYFNEEKYYVGYWQNGKKQGQGTIYLLDGKKHYEGNFNFDMIEGRGKYFLPDTGEFYEGVFDCMGNGEGVFFWANGNYWKGRFTYHLLDGTGMFYNNKKEFVKSVEYMNGELVVTKNKDNIQKRRFFK